MRIIKPEQGMLIASAGEQIQSIEWPLDLLGALGRASVVMWWPPLCCFGLDLRLPRAHAQWSRFTELSSDLLPLLSTSLCLFHYNLVVVFGKTN